MKTVSLLALAIVLFVALRRRRSSTKIDVSTPHVPAWVYRSDISEETLREAYPGVTTLDRIRAKSVLAKTRSTAWRTQ